MCFWGEIKGQRISFSGQVRNYQSTVSQVVNLLGGQTQAADYLKRCIYSIGLGSNDYLNNYFMPTFYSSSRQFTPEQYATDLINRYSTQLNVRFPYGYLYYLCFGSLVFSDYQVFRRGFGSIL